MNGAQLPQGPGDRRDGKFYGFYVGIVTNNKDPEKLGRCKVNFPWLHTEGSEESFWARPSYPMAGAGRGFWFIPEIGDEVLCGFEHGDVRFPYFLGSLYNGQDRPPTFGEPGNQDFNEDGQNNLRGIKSRCGHMFLFDDGGSAVKLQDKNGNIVHLDTDNDDILVTANQNVFIEAKSGDVNIKAARHVKSSAGVNVEGTAGANVELTSGAATKFAATGTMDFKSGAPMTIASSATTEMSSAAAMTINAGSNLDAGSAGDMSIGSSATSELTAGANMNLTSAAKLSFGATGPMTIGAGASFTGGGQAEMCVGSDGALTLTAPLVNASGGGEMVCGSDGVYATSAAVVMKN